jgi:hypothetical protein
MKRVMKITGDCCWQITHLLSSIVKRRRATHFEHASLWPQGPYAVKSSGSAHTAQQSSIHKRTMFLLCSISNQCNPAVPASRILGAK